MSNKPVRVKTVDYYSLLIYNFGIMIPGFLIFTQNSINIFVIIVFIVSILLSSLFIFRRSFIAEFDDVEGLIMIKWSKNIIQTRKKDILIKVSDIITIEEPYQIGFYPNIFILKFKNNSNFKFFNPIFSLSDDYERFKGILNGLLYHEKTK